MSTRCAITSLRLRGNRATCSVYRHNHKSHCILEFPESELRPQLRRGGSLRIPRASEARVIARRRAHTASTRSSPSSTSTSTSSSSSAVSDRCASCDTSFRSVWRYAPVASDAPAPEYLARSLLQLGCPAVSMPT